MKLVLALTLLSSLSLAHAGERFCAKVFQGPDFTGEKLVLRDGDRYRNLGRLDLDYEYGDWDNRVSSAVVARGCKLVGFQYLYFNRDYGFEDGFREVLRGPRKYGRRVRRYSYLGYADNKFSSLKCSCR